MKKRIGIIIGVVMLTALVAVPVMAQGPGMGRGYGMGPGMMWNQGYGPGNGQGYGPGNCPGFNGGGRGFGGGPGWGRGQALSEEDQAKLKAAFDERESFAKETAGLRQKLETKSLEMRALMSNPETTDEALLAKQNEVFELRNLLAQKNLVFARQMQKKYPELASGYGRGPGRGFGRGMGRGFGMGPGAGFGPGACWR